MGKVKLIRWPRLALGVMVLLFAGLIYAWSILKTPFEEYWDPTQLGLNFTLMVIFFCLGGLISGLMSKKTSAALRLSISAVLLFSGFFISSRLGGGSIIPLYFAYGVLGGVGIGFAFNTVISVTNAWFPDKQGLSSGILLMSFGMSTFVIGNLANILGESEAIGWRNTYVILAVSMALILAVAAVFVRLPPHDTVFPTPKSAKKALIAEGVRDYSSLEMIKRPSFYKIFAYDTVLAAPGFAAIFAAKDIMTDVNAPQLAVIVASLLAVFNGLGRLVCGWLFDNLGIRKTQFISSSLNILAPLTVVFGIMAASIPICFAGVCLCGFTYGFTPTTGSVFVARFYGLKNYPLNYSLINMILIPAPFAATLAGWIKDSTGSFLTAFIILTATSMVGFLVNLSIKKP